MDLKLTRDMTPADKVRLQTMLTVAGKRNMKMSKERVGDYLHKEYPAVFPFTKGAGWVEFLEVALGRPNETTTLQAYPLEKIGGLLFRETLGGQK